MHQNHDSKGELRAAFAMRELENAKRSLQAGSIGIFMRVTLAIIFMYLIVVSYLMLGITGPVFVSILFLAAFFTPYLYQALKNLLDKRKAEEEDRISGSELPEEG